MPFICRGDEVAYVQLLYTLFRRYREKAIEEERFGLLLINVLSLNMIGFIQYVTLRSGSVSLILSFDSA